MKTVIFEDVVRTSRVFQKQGFLTENHSWHIRRPKMISSLLLQRNTKLINSKEKKKRRQSYRLWLSWWASTIWLSWYTAFFIELPRVWVPSYWYSYPSFSYFSSLSCIFSLLQPYSAVQFILDLNCNTKNCFIYSLYIHVKTRDYNSQMNMHKHIVNTHIHTLAASVSI